MTNVFDDNATPPANTDETATPPSTTSDPIVDLLGQVKNENGEQKYKDPQALIKGMNDAQEFIKTLQAENNQYKADNEAKEAELVRQRTVDDVLERLKEDKPGETVTPDLTPGLSTEDVDKLIAKRLADNAQAQSASSNTEKVSKALVEKYGDKAQEVMLQTAKDNGFTKEEFRDLAGSKPQVVLNLLNATGSFSSSQSTPTTYNVSTPAPQESEAPKPSKNMLVGASDRERGDYIKDIRRHVYAKHGIAE